MTDSDWTPDDWFEQEISGEIDAPGGFAGERLFDLSIDDDPDPVEWLEWDESERAAAILEAHEFDLPEGHPIPEGSWQLHAMFHCIIENQLAANDPPAARETLARLRREGVPRHDAIHALASVVAEHMQNALSSQTEVGVPALEKDYRALDASVWR